MRRDPPHYLEQLAQAGRLDQRVDDARHRRGDPRPPVDPSHRVGVPGPQPPLVVVRVELGLVGRHVNVDRALALATLAGQAEVERLADRLGLPQPFHRVALEHLEEQVGAAAGRMHVLLRDHVAGAHRPRILLAALAHADAALGGVREAAVVVGELEVRLHLDRVIARPHAQVLAGQRRVDDPVRVHLVLRVPDRLELAEGVHQLGPEHLRQERRLGLPVAVLARDRPAVPADHVGRLIQVRAEMPDALDRLQIEVDPRVDTPLAEVSIQGAVVAVLLEELAEVDEVILELVGMDGRVLPPLPGVLVAGDPRGCAEARLPHFPQVLLLGLVVEELH